eukprot:9503961-Pyramimonas_sp.AAC.2
MTHTQVLPKGCAPGDCPAAVAAPSARRGTTLHRYTPAAVAAPSARRGTTLHMCVPGIPDYT